jgi:hypothetical protein
MGKLGAIITTVILVALLFAGFLWVANMGTHSGTITPTDSASGTSSSSIPPLVLSTPTGTAPAGSQSISDGTITLIYSTAEFGLATSQQQLPTKSYIPPCDAGFDYCLYYTGTAYQGTNFESAGLRVQKRTDLTTQSACLTTPPTGFTNFTPTSTTGGDYSVSEFAPIGNAGAGHFSKGTLYRLEYNGACYEFETRIGQSQFANYPTGTIQQFTDADQSTLQAEIQNILNGITLPSGETVTFPQ